ncbi:Universal stress protein E [Thermoflexales bacterium]|nr:Universal stress protein E [Thermoflexales bacterium]
MFKKILVPLDGSPLSQRALQPALTLSQPTGAELLLVRVPVVDTLSFAVSEARQRQLVQDALLYLETLRKSNEQPQLNLRTQVLTGDAASAIIDTARAEQADLIVMSTHGYSGLTRWVLGSVTEKVLRSAPCPVLAVRAARPPQRVLITLDGSPLAEHALDPGISIAQNLQAEATLLRCVPHVATNGKLDEHERGLSRRMQEELLLEAKEYLRARADAASRSGVALKTEVRIGSPADSILEYIETYGIDLIVMATHGRTGLKRWVYGSVTAKVLRSANCSMLVIRPTDAELN